MSVTIKDIARVTGVSYSTVSKALQNSPLVKENTKQKILMVARQMGYQPNMAARSLVSKKSQTVGLVWPTIEQIATSSLVTKISEELQKKSYHMLLSIDPIESAVKLFERFQVDGVIVFDGPKEPEQKPNYFPVNIPLVFYGESMHRLNPTFDVKRRQAIKQAVHYLGKLGHRGIAFIGNRSQVIQQQKFIGFIEGMNDLGLLFRQELIVDTSDFTAADGYQAAKTIFQSSVRPTAIIGGSYDLTTGILRAAHEMQLRIPEDLSIVSYDNIPQMANLDIPVTAVGVPVDKVAKSIVAYLLEFINHPDVTPTFETVDAELVERASCAALRS